MTRRPTVEYAAALLALATLLAGLGALGWLVGHLATYDAVGHHHAHATHGYMEPLVRLGLAGAGAGIALVLLALAFGRRALDDLVRRSRSPLPWALAAAVPAATFSIVEVLEGSAGVARPELLVVGLPLQLLVGVLVLALVRTIVLGLARAVELLSATPRTEPSPRRPCRARRRPTFVLPRLAPMASSAPRRGPPARSVRA